MFCSLGNFDPFGTTEEIPIPSNETHLNVNLPSLDSIHDQVHHQSPETSSIEQAGPSLDLIDSHPHSHDDEDASVIDSAKRALIQPSIDFLDAQLHGGEEHVHQEKSPVDKEAADLNDFKHWLEEQNQTNQLTRFLLLQKEINRLRLDDKKDLQEKLNRTIKELKSVKFDL
jgi:hypothetical protein